MTRAIAVPRKVFLFSGHMIDAPNRETSRFPPEKEPVVADATRVVLGELDAGSEDLSICGGACGGDLLFAEASLTRGVPLEMYLPFDEATFVVGSVDFAGGNWHERFLAAKSACTLHVMPEERGPLAEGDDAYEQNNLWMLEAASRFGAEKVEFIYLWNGQGGDGPGGTQHLLKEVQRRAGHAHWLDTRLLWR